MNRVSNRLILLTFLTQGYMGLELLPPEWRGMCTETLQNNSQPSGRENSTVISASPSLPTPSTAFLQDMTLAASVSASTVIAEITCSVKQTLRLADLREWSERAELNADTLPSNRTVVYKLSVECEGEGQVSLPWPARVTGLVELHVRRCYLTDR